MNEVPALNLHHVGYAVSSIEPIAVNYVSRYGYEISTPIIHDPLQTAFVQVPGKLRGDSSYLEFVAPDGPNAAKLTGAVKLGTGIHHLCFMSGPLEITIAHLEQSKMKLISDPKPGVAFAGRRICWLLGQKSTAADRTGRASEMSTTSASGWPRRVHSPTESRGSIDVARSLSRRAEKVPPLRYGRKGLSYRKRTVCNAYR